MVDIRLNGQNKQLFGNNGELKAGVKKEQIKDGNMKAIFNVVDADKNGVLDSNELEKFKQKIIAEAKDEVLSDKDAKQFFKKENVAGLKKEDIASFLELLSQSAENIESSTAEEKNGEKFIHIKYKDGTKETLNPDKTSQIVSQGPNGETITKKLDKNRQVSEETVVTQDGKSTVTSYKDGKPVKVVTTPKGGVPVTTVVYDESGQPKSSTVKSGSTTENYTYVNGQPQLTSKIENEGVAAKEKLTTYKYNSDGTVATEIKENGKETSQLIKDGKIVNETIKEGNKTTTKEYNENGFEETIVEGDKKTQTAYNSENKKLSQTVTTQGKTYSVEYDGKGGTKIVLGNGESIGALAEKFGCTKEELLNANGGKIRGWAGDEISVPGEISADDKRLQGRQTKEQAIDAYKVVADEIEQNKNEANTRKNITFTNKDYDTYEELAKSLFKREGNSTFSAQQLQQRIEDLKKTNPGLKDGELKGKKITGGVAPEMYERIANKDKSVNEYKQTVKTREDGKNIADNLYKICDDKAGAAGSKEFKAEMQKINPQNVTAVLDAYDKVIEKNPGDTSLMDTICSEVTATESSKRQALTQIMDNLAQAAKDAGVSDADIAKAKKDYQESMDKEFGARLRRTNPKDMEKAVDFLRGAIAAKNTSNVQDMSEKDAIKTFNSDYAAKDSEAQKTYADARKEEGWTAKVGDSVAGWFGCTTIEEMDKKLGKNAADVKRLAASSANEAEFKTAYKEVFGVEFDKNKIAARDAALGNYQQAQNLSSTMKITGDIMKASNNLDYAGLRNEIKQKFQLDDKTLDSVIESYAGSLDRKMSTDTDKKDMLMRFLESTRENSSTQYRELAKGKTLEQMGKDLELLTKSAFGTNDIVKDVIQFNENQQTTEMVTEAGFEIAGTIALQFVPGLGQMAAAKLAVSAAKWGTKAVQVVNYANKTEKAFVAVNKLQNLNKATKIGGQMANAGAATAAVGLSNGDEAKEVMRKTLMNMSFAGIGAGSSTVMTSKLASRIMTNFHVQDSMLAKEIAEEIINAVGSYGVTKVAGDDYGSNDAFVDIASGIVMARISHIKPNTNVNVTPDVTPTPVAPKSGVTPDVITTPVAPKPEAKAKAENEAKAKAENEAKAKAENEAKAKAENEAKAKAENEAKAKAENEAKAKAESEAKAKAENEAKAKAENEAKAKAEHEAKTKAENEAKAKAAEAQRNRMSSDEYGNLKDNIDNLEKELNKLKAKSSYSPAELQGYRKILEVAPNEPLNAETIKKARRKLSLKYHPDKGGSTAKMQEINNALDKIEKKLKNNDVDFALIQQKEAELNKLHEKAKSAKLSENQRMAEAINKKIENLKDGEGIVFGRQNSYAFENDVNSRSQIKITKQNGEIILENIGRNPIEINGVKMSGGSQMMLAEGVGSIKMPGGEIVELNIPKKVQVNDDIDTSQSTAKPKRNIFERIFGKKQQKTHTKDDEFVRVAGNGGREIDPIYIKTSREIREHFNNAIDSGAYTGSFESYKKMMNEAHVIAYQGKSGQDMYYKKDDVLVKPNEINAGKFLARQRAVSGYLQEAQAVDKIAKKYGDSYRSSKSNRIILEGIPEDGLPINLMEQHHYPGSKYLDHYYQQMHRTAKESIDLINSGASKVDILKKIAEHYQYAANARPYRHINNSLFMNEVNTLLIKAGLNTMPHGNLDHAAMRLQPEAFKRCFVDVYAKTSL